MQGTRLTRLLVAAGIMAAMGSARAEPLAPGSIGPITGAITGTGADTSRLGFGWMWGVAAAWQPMRTEQRIGWAIKWSVAEELLYRGSAAQITKPIDAWRLDAMLGARVRISADGSGFLTFRAGGTLLRANQVIPPYMERVFSGAVLSAGVDQHLGGWLLSFEFPYYYYGVHGGGPSMLGFVIGFSKAGP